MRPSSISTLGQLIEVPPIRVVIQLADLDDARLRDEILDSFVFTDEVETDLPVGRRQPGDRAKA